MDDYIRRQAAIDALIKWYGCEPSDIGAFENIIEKLPPAQQWIPIKTRPMNEEERTYYTEIYGELEDEDAVMSDCQMPEDGQEIWICTKDGVVYLDICEADDWIRLKGGGDWKDIVAWMPHYMPKPWKGENDEVD